MHISNNFAFASADISTSFDRLKNFSSFFVLNFPLDFNFLSVEGFEVVEASPEEVPVAVACAAVLVCFSPSFFFAAEDDDDDDEEEEEDEEEEDFFFFFFFFFLVDAAGGAALVSFAEAAAGCVPASALRFFLASVFSPPPESK